MNNAFEPKGPLDQAAGDKGAGYITTGVSVESQISLIINTVLSLIGVIFLILAIYAGFKWMTAAGNEEAVDKAKNTIINATIGLIVVLAAYAISWFIINILGRAVFKT